MKPEQIVLILAIGFLFLEPPPQPVVANTTPFVAYENEGMVAVQKNDTKFEQPTPEKKECTCKGTGFVLSPDGIQRIKCPCVKCECKRTGQVEESPKVLEKQILFFTSKTCAPCQRFLREQAPELISKNWGVNEKEDSLIRVVDVDENPELFNKYKSQDAVPTFCLLKNGEKVKDLVGYRIAKDITDLWYQN